MSKELQRITGHANQAMQQFKGIATAATTINFYGFMPVNGNAVVSVLTNVDGTSAVGYNDSTTFYQGVYYPGNFSAITLTSGKALLYLNEQ